MVGLLAACGEEPPAPEPEPTPTTVAVAESPLADPTPVAEEEEVAAAATTPAPATPGNGTTVFTPLVVDDSPDCPIESNLDLAGYVDLEERLGCALTQAKFDPVAINEFGEGPDYNRFMLWVSSEGTIYVLLPGGAWEVYADEWQEGDPTFTCNPLDIEPDSPPLPRRGFGKLWCEMPELQTVMGTIDREERLCQHAVDQRFEEGRLIACFEDATIRYFRLLDDGTWDVTLQ